LKYNFEKQFFSTYDFFILESTARWRHFNSMLPSLRPYRTLIKRYLGMVRVLLQRENDILTAEGAENCKGIMFEKCAKKKQSTLSAILCVLGG